VRVDTSLVGQLRVNNGVTKCQKHTLSIKEIVINDCDIYHKLIIENKTCVSSVTFIFYKNWKTDSNIFIVGLSNVDDFTTDRGPTKILVAPTLNLAHVFPEKSGVNVKQKSLIIANYS